MANQMMREPLKAPPQKKGQTITASKDYFFGALSQKLSYQSQKIGQGIEGVAFICYTKIAHNLLSTCWLSNITHEWA